MVGQFADSSGARNGGIQGIPCDRRKLKKRSLGCCLPELEHGWVEEVGRVGRVGRDEQTATREGERAIVDA